MSIQETLREMGRLARTTGPRMAEAATGQKNDALLRIAEAFAQRQDELQTANEQDLTAGRERGLNDALLDRLTLTPQRIASMAEGLRQIAALPDPVGEITDLNHRPSGIRVGRMRVPLGVVGIIYESRPNVTADAAGLCMKAGNAVILRGGSEAFASNHAIARCIHAGLRDAGLPPEAVQVVATKDREAVGEMLRMKEYIDVIVPRGGKSLVARVSEEARIPVIKHLDGICHVYIDDQAAPEKAHAIAFNAKTHRYGVCNAMETLLVAEGIADQVLPGLVKAYRDTGVEVRGCAKTRAVVAEGVGEASEEDWDTEYLAPILSIKIVADIEEAIRHIEAHGSRHTESIVTENWTRANRFLAAVDSSSVMVNASTRFADGFEYGLGAEIGISTDKIHARGPVGLEGLTSQKFIVLGDGHIRV